MNGGVYRLDDVKFIQLFFFGSYDIQIWVNLKLCSFKFVKEGNYQESYDVQEPRQN